LTEKRLPEPVTITKGEKASGLMISAISSLVTTRDTRRESKQSKHIILLLGRRATLSRTEEIRNQFQKITKTGRSKRPKEQKKTGANTKSRDIPVKPHSRPAIGLARLPSICVNLCSSAVERCFSLPRINSCLFAVSTLTLPHPDLQRIGGFDPWYRH